MKKKLLTVIMSVKNGEQFVEKSIDSILMQTFKDFHFFIADDCSTDNTLNILYKKQSEDSRISIFKNQTNIGLTKTLNKLIDSVESEFIARQDADDLSLPNRLEVQLDYIKRKQLELCTARALIKDTNQKIPNLSFFFPNKYLINYKNPFIHGTLVIKKNFLESMGNYNEKFYFAQDYKLFYDILKKNIKINTVKKPLYILNTTNNISENFKKEQKYFADCVRKRLEPLNFQS